MSVGVGCLRLIFHRAVIPAHWRPTSENRFAVLISLKTKQRLFGAQGMRLLVGDRVVMAGLLGRASGGVVIRLLLSHCRWLQLRK